MPSKMLSDTINVDSTNKVFLKQIDSRVLGLPPSSFAKKMLDESRKTGYDVVGYNL